MLKFLHLICGTTFLGIIIASFFYIANSIKKSDRELIDYSLKASYFGDAIIFFIIIVQLITAIKLVVDGNFTLAIPWILIAHYAFAIVIILWLGILLLKLRYLSNPNISSTTIKIYYLFNIMIILIFIIIIHDAVTQSTWFEFLFGK